MSEHCVSEVGDCFSRLAERCLGVQNITEVDHRRTKQCDDLNPRHFIKEVPNVVECPCIGSEDMHLLLFEKPCIENGFQKSHSYYIGHPGYLKLKSVHIICHSLRTLVTVLSEARDGYITMGAGVMARPRSRTSTLGMASAPMTPAMPVASPSGTPQTNFGKLLIIVCRT